MRRNTRKERKRQITCETQRDLKGLFYWREQETSPCKPGYTCTNVKVTNFLIFQLRTKCCNGPLWLNSTMGSTLAPHYASLDLQLFSVCLTLKGHTGTCQHTKGHVFCNKGIWLREPLSRRMRILIQLQLNGIKLYARLVLSVYIVYITVCDDISLFNWLHTKESEITENNNSLR